MNDTAPVAGKIEKLTQKQISEIEYLSTRGRNDVIKVIRHHLKKRTGKAWSVSGGSGTAWGWITITAPPTRRIDHGYMTPDDTEELGLTLGTTPAHRQGINVPSQTDYYRQFLCRAIHGHAGPFHATPQWD